MERKAESAKSPTWIVEVGTAAAVLLLTVLVYRGTFATLWRTWATNPNYSHGYLIPPVVAFLLWRDRGRFLDRRSSGSGWGVFLVAVALLGHVVSLRAGVFMTQGYSFVLLLFGLSLIFFGGRATRTVWFPLAYLVFMLPMPPYLMNVASFRLKLVAAHVGSAIAIKMGIPLARSGMTIHIPAGSLRIADPCSGLRSLIALVALGALFAWFTSGRGWKRGVLFLSAIPLAVLGNTIRIAILCAVANVWGIDVALGFFHDFSGFLLFAIALCGFFIVRRLLRCEGDGAGDAEEEGCPAGQGVAR